MEQTNTTGGIQLSANNSNNTSNQNNNNSNTSGNNLVNQQSNLNTSGNSNSGSVIVHQGLNQSTGQQSHQVNDDIGANTSETRRLSQGGQSNTTSPGLSPQGKTFGRNFNGTMVVTSTPSNEAELQLYRVLQRASLLAYYDTLLEMGGDDVQQLCDAGEEEFLEIMALVGMASKPLHVRRLQKALHEWVNNPTSFQTPLSNTEHKIFPDTPRMMLSPEPVNSTTIIAGVASRNLFGSPITSSSTIGSTNPPSFTALQHPIVATNLTSFNQLSSTANPILPTSSSASSTNASSHHHHHHQLSGPSMSQLTPSLSEAQINRLIQAAERLSRQLPQIEPKQQNLKKRSSRELEQVMTMSESDPRRMDEIRKYAAIYGRFDCKRRPEKPLTLHEVCVNEAAAQICKYVPALLTRRHELFPLARQIVRDSGFGHSSGVARFGLTSQNLNRNIVDATSDLDSTMNSTTGSSGNQMKRTRLSSETSADLVKDLLEESRNNSLLSIYQRIGKTFDLTDSTMRFGYSKSDFDDNDSTFSFGSSNSPIHVSNGIEHNENSLPILENPLYNRSGNNNDSNTSHHMDRNMKSPEPMDSPVGVQIISSSGGHIIAVANPALALSAALNETFANMKRETASPDDIR